MPEDLITLLAALDGEEDPVVDENLQLYLEQCEEYIVERRRTAMYESVYEILPVDDGQNRDEVMKRIRQQNSWMKYFSGRVVRLASALEQNRHRRDKIQLRAATRHFHKGNVSCAELYAGNISTYFAGTWELKEWLKEHAGDRMYNRKSEMGVVRDLAHTFLSAAVAHGKNKRPKNIKISQKYFAAAIECFEEAVEIMRSLANSYDDGFFHRILVEVMAELAAAHRENNDWPAAEKHLLEAIATTWKMFENKDRYYHLPDLVSLLQDLGGLYRKMELPDRSESIFTESLEFYEKFADAHKWEHGPVLGRLMSLLADFYRADKPDRERSVSFAGEAVVLIEYTKDADRLAAKNRAIEILKEWKVPDDELELLLKETWRRRNPEPDEPCPELRQWLAAEPSAQDFASLLCRLPEYETPAPKDKQNLETYLGRCPEYNGMQEALDKLNSVLKSLPSRSEFYYEGKIAEEIRTLEFWIENFRLHVREIARRLNGGSPCSLTHRDEARAYFENYQVMEAGVYSFAFYGDEDTLKTTLESHIRHRAEREENLADFLNEIARVFLSNAMDSSRSGLSEEAEKYFKAARFADAGVTEGVILPEKESPADDTPPLPPPPPAEPAEDFVSLLCHLNTTPSWKPEDHENFNRYLANCGEYTKMQRDVARLDSIFPHLKVPEDKENRYQVMVNANDLNSQIGEFEDRVLKAAQRIAAGDENDPAIRRALECFNRLALEEAEYFAFFEDWSKTNRSFEELENEWNEYLEELEYMPSYDRMSHFFKKLSDDFFTIAWEKGTAAETVAQEEVERYFKASICAEEYLQNSVAYAMFLQNNRRFIEAGDKYIEALEKFGSGMDDHDRLAILDNLGMIEVDNELYDRARKTLFSAVEISRRLLPDDAPKHRPSLGKALNRLGRTLFRLDEIDAAKEYLLEALELNRELMKTDPYNFEPQVMEGLGDLAQVHARDRDFDAIEKYFLEAIELARKLAGEEKYFKTRLGFFLTAMAATHAEMLNIEAAERGYDESWVLFSDLAAEEPKTYILDLAQRSMMRADFYQRYKREERERSIWDAADAFVLAYGFPSDPSAVNIAFKAKEILEDWELDAGEIGHRLNFQEAVRGNLLESAKKEL